MPTLNSDEPRFQIKRRLRPIYRKVRGTIESWRSASTINAAKAALPLVFAEKAYNPAHSDYEPELVRCYSGRIFNADKACSNPLFLEIKKRAIGRRVPHFGWRRTLQQSVTEAATVPGFAQVMERVAYIDNYTSELGRQYGSHYVPGWVNLVDAQFLYWAVRHAKPNVIVQTGVSNGLSSAFMMLALAKN